MPAAAERGEVDAAMASGAESLRAPEWMWWSM